MANSMEAAFGKGAESIGKHFVAAKRTGAQVTEKALAFVNQLGQDGKAMTPYWRPLGIGTAAGIGLAVVLSNPPNTPSLSVPYVHPNLASGTGGGLATPGNIHPDTPLAGQPTVSPMVSAGNTARVSMPSGHRVRIRGRSSGQLDMSGLQSSIQQSMGGNASVNANISDRRQSLTEQHVADILSKG